VGGHGLLFRFWINDGLIVFRVVVVSDPKLESKFLGAIPHRDLIDAGLMSSPKLEMDRSVRSDNEVFWSSDDVTAIQSFDCYRLTWLCRRILNPDVDSLVMAQANAVKTALVRRDGYDLVTAQIDRRRRFTCTVSRLLSTRRRCWTAMGDQGSVCLNRSLREKRFRSGQGRDADDQCEEKQPMKNFHGGFFARSAESRLDNQFEII
jgi:hypothetical protein